MMLWCGILIAKITKLLNHDIPPLILHHYIIFIHTYTLICIIVNNQQPYFFSTIYIYSIQIPKLRTKLYNLIYYLLILRKWQNCQKKENMSAVEGKGSAGRASPTSRCTHPFPATTADFLLTYTSFHVCSTHAWPVQDIESRWKTCLQNA